MTTPILHLASATCTHIIDDPLPELGKLGKLNGTAKAIAVTTLVDALMTVTSLVIAILGTMSILPIPPAVSYSLFGIAGGSTALWVIASMFSKGAICKQSLKYTKESFSCNPVEEWPTPPIQKKN